MNEFEIEKEKYSIKFQSKSIYTCEMLIYQNKDSKYKYDLLLKPIEIILEDLNLFAISILFFSEFQIKSMISNYNKNYEFIDSDNQALNENKSIQDLKSITIIGKKSYNIDINEENIIKEIDPHLLSFNFYEIFSDNVKKEKTFKLIQAQMV